MYQYFRTALYDRYKTPRNFLFYYICRCTLAIVVIFQDAWGLKKAYGDGMQSHLEDFQDVVLISTITEPNFVLWFFELQYLALGVWIALSVYYWTTVFFNPNLPTSSLRKLKAILSMQPVKRAPSNYMQTTNIAQKDFNFDAIRPNNALDVGRNE